MECKLENQQNKDSLLNSSLKRLYFTNKKSFKEATLFDQQLKASHNSFDKGPLQKQLTYDKDFPAFGGCLSIEFDLVQNHNLLGKNDEWEFYLQHGKKYDKKSKKLTQALEEVQKWSEQNKNHPPIIIYLDIKTEMCFGDPIIQTEKLDEQILRHIKKDQLYTPMDMLKHEKNIITYIKKYGYPKVSELLNKFIFVMSGSEKDIKTHTFRTTYYTHNYQERIAFLDLDARIFPLGALVDISQKNEIQIKDKKLEKKEENKQKQAKRKSLWSKIKDNLTNFIYLGKKQDFQSKSQLNFDKNNNNFLIEKEKFLENRFIYNVPVKQEGWENIVQEARKKGYLTRVFQANNEKDWKKACKAGVHHIATDKIFQVDWTKF